MELIADYGKQEVTVRQLGINPSRIGDQLLSKGDTYMLGPGGCFQLVQGCYKYHIYFGKRVPENVLEELQKNGDETDMKEGTFQPTDNVAALRYLAGDEEGSERKRGVSNDAESNSPKRVKLDTTPVHADRSVLTSPSKSDHPGRSQQKSLDAFFKAKSDSGADAARVTNQLEMQWQEVDTLLVFQHGPPVHTPKIAAFDLDGTLIETASGKRFATGPKDWKLTKNVAEKLLSFHKEGFKIVLLSNQLGILKGKPTKAELRQKIEAIARKLQVPLLLLASTSRDNYRKPCTGMWQHLVRHENGGVMVDEEASFYVGDAAGREANWMPGGRW